jgi:hypothetical protein
VQAVVPELSIWSAKRKYPAGAFAASIRLPNADFHVRSGKFAGRGLVGVARRRWAGGRGATRAAGSFSSAEEDRYFLIGQLRNG